ncbi:energy transducer TonB [Massilia pseudoviolaceinigra]|uniref:energy transducer TonB n=1 Tax=Massilia pseudoviolaceinigra TaxID=3057165 RepID=UPI002796C2B0|nr:TonB C-terminal domain-containing protein [Massilia sp. CCM 9206]MDQ1921509.1 TonB C-terminal domain-containing protein [Massilia sp. CCM 9206]
MPHIPPFLARLGLDRSADERAIRRAYARQLKQIDQETEADRFQILRTDYESALAWLSWASHEDEDDDDDGIDDRIGDGGDHSSASADAGHASDGGPEPQQPSYAPSQAPVAYNVPTYRADADVAPSARDAGMETDPEQLADAVFQQFLDALAKLRAGRMLYDDGLWADELQRCLNDDRLLNIAARMVFEARITYFLAGTRQLGHETLFFAALGVFGWMSDRHRLERFGHPGAIVNRAIDERNMFHVQDQADRVGQQEVLSALRRPAVPRLGEVRRMMPHLQTMMARFPVLMRIIADQEAIGRWQEAYASLTAKSGAPLTVKESEWAAAGETEKSGSSYGWIIGVMILLSTLFNTMKSKSPNIPIAPPPTLESLSEAPWRPSPPKLGQEQDYAPLLTAMNKNPRTASSPARPKGEPLTRAQLDEIGSRIDYKVDKDAAPGLRSVEFEVLLDARGKVKSLKKLSGSGDQRYEDAVAKAMRESKPFPASTTRFFSVTHSVRITRVLRPPQFVSPPVPVFPPPSRELGQAPAVPEPAETKPRPAPPPPDEANEDPLTTQ